MQNKTFHDLFELNYIFNLRQLKVNLTTKKLLDEGYFMNPSEKTKQDIQQAQFDNYETEHLLRKHFLNI